VTRRTAALVAAAALLMTGCADHQANRPQAKPSPVTEQATAALPPPDWDTIDRCQDEIRAGRSPVAWQDETGPCAELPPVWWDHAVQVVDDEAWCTRTCEGEDYRCTPICEDN
jgi:hypothetical protein